MIDAHCHFGPGLRAEAPFGPLFKADEVQDLLSLLDAVGIERAVIFAPSWQGGWGATEFNDPSYERANIAVAEAVREHPDRFIGFARLNPKFGAAAVRELERCFDEYGFRGLKLDNEADGFHATDLRILSPLAEILKDRRAPMIVHTGFHPCEPLIYLPLAQAFPEVPVILGHMGGRILIDAIITAQHAANVYLETSGQMPAYIARAVKAVGADRIIFGTDTPYNIPSVEVDRIARIGLTEEEFRKITRQNIVGLLRLAEAAPAAA